MKLLEGVRQVRLEADVVTYGSAINSCGRGNRWQHSLALTSELWLVGVPASLAALNTCASACGKGQEWQRALELLALAPRLSTSGADGFSLATACDACAQAGRWREALAVLTTARHRMELGEHHELQAKRKGRSSSAVLLGATVSACSNAACWAQALGLMLSLSAAWQEAPNSVIFNAVLRLSLGGGRSASPGGKQTGSPGPPSEWRARAAEAL
ncbi:unnamed protein product [Polarella glacialis]|uniref:Pentatricopeptide repeat-containing protein, chloroplastic n=1 Tax=Polarella glacialis TaxID=89957 RepID=A0A813EJW0_POLGL|nr:unnamed protein product [Polarella glacialis]